MPVCGEQEPTLASADDRLVACHLFASSNNIKGSPQVQARP
jgi:hypothetical protein